LTFIVPIRNELLCTFVDFEDLVFFESRLFCLLDGFGLDDFLCFRKDLSVELELVDLSPEILLQEEEDIEE